METEIVEKRPRGRPAEYSPELADKICEEIAGGNNFNRMSQSEDWPTRQSLYRWLRENEYFSDNYARAIKERAHTRFDRTDDIIRDLRGGVIDAATARLEFDVVRWQAGKEDPKKYGDSTTIKGDKENPLHVSLGARLDEAIARLSKS